MKINSVARKSSAASGSSMKAPPETSTLQSVPTPASAAGSTAPAAGRTEAADACARIEKAAWPGEEKSRAVSKFMRCSDEGIYRAGGPLPRRNGSLSLAPSASPTSGRISLSTEELSEPFIFSVGGKCRMQDAGCRSLPFALSPCGRFLANSNLLFAFVFPHCSACRASSQSRSDARLTYCNNNLRTVNPLPCIQTRCRSARRAVTRATSRAAASGVLPGVAQ